MGVFGVKKFNTVPATSRLFTVNQLNQPLAVGTWVDAGTQNWSQLLTCSKNTVAGGFICATAFWQNADPAANNNIFTAHSATDANPTYYNYSFPAGSTANGFLDIKTVPANTNSGLPVGSLVAVGNDHCLYSASYPQTTSEKIMWQPVQGGTPGILSIAFDHNGTLYAVTTQHTIATFDGIGLNGLNNGAWATYMCFGVGNALCHIGTNGFYQWNGTGWDKLAQPSDGIISMEMLGVGGGLPHV